MLALLVAFISMAHDPAWLWRIHANTRGVTLDSIFTRFLGSEGRLLEAEIMVDIEILIVFNAFENGPVTFST